jgi:hypothetical protein
MDGRKLVSPSEIRPTRYAPLIATAAIAAVFAMARAAALGETLGSCETCREYNRACLQAHSKQACKSELEMCLKHCGRKK